MRLRFPHRFIGFFRLLSALVFSSLMVAGPATAQDNGQYTIQEIVDAGHSFFGSASGGLAKVVESAFQKYGLPNGYILG
ncbi:MAG: EipA family protein, partial [Rhizobium sp.]